jgi:hypothetical protein
VSQSFGFWPASFDVIRAITNRSSGSMKIEPGLFYLARVELSVLSGEWVRLAVGRGGNLGTALDTPTSFPPLRDK